ncbi:MAG: LpxD N-terminal domain-containing protein, partial [Gemmatimonadales bacterium]
MTTAAATLTAAAVAELVGGRLEGDGTVQLHAVGPLDRAHGDALSFLASPKYIDQFLASRAGAVLVPLDLPADTPGPATRIVVRDPADAIARVVTALFPPTRPAPGIDPSVRIGTGCRLGQDLTLGAHVVVGDGAVLGDRVVLGSGVVLEPGV